MRSLVLSTAARLLLPLMLVFSVFLLLRGHNEPGGGFAGGLVAAAAFALYSIAEGVERARDLLRADPRSLIAAGLGLALLSGLVGVVGGGEFLHGSWLTTPIPGIGKIGTPVVFDAGVYLLVLGMALLILFTLAEEE